MDVRYRPRIIKTREKIGDKISAQKQVFSMSCSESAYMTSTKIFFSRRKLENMYNIFFEFFSDVDKKGPGFKCTKGYIKKEWHTQERKKDK